MRKVGIPTSRKYNSGIVPILTLRCTYIWSPPHYLVHVRVGGHVSNVLYITCLLASNKPRSFRKLKVHGRVGIGALEG